MKLNIKNYKILKTKEYFKTNNFFFIADGTTKNSLDWLLVEQGIKVIEFNFYKLLNKTTLKTVNNSVYNFTKPVINGSTFIITPQLSKYFLKQTALTNFNALIIKPLIIKFNNRAYSVTSINNLYSLEYKEAKLLFYQFNLAHLKNCYKISK